MGLTALLHSVSYSGSWGQARLGVEDFVRKAADLGYAGVMLMAKRPHLSVLDYDEAACSRLRKVIAESGLTHVCVAGYNNFSGDLEHAEVPVREIQIHYVTELARLTRDIGGNLLRVFTAYENPAAGYLPQWDLVVDVLKDCARRAAEFGVTLGVQNHHDIAVDFRSQYDLIQAVGEPNCKALFDAWSPALQGTDIAEAAKMMAPVTAHTTIANYQKRPRFRYDPAVVNYVPLTPYAQAVPIEEGFIDYRAFLSALRQGGFRGTVAYEMCSPLLGGGGVENLDRYAQLFLRFLNSLE